MQRGSPVRIKIDQVVATLFNEQCLISVVIVSEQAFFK